MQVLIDVKDSKADFVLEWLKRHSYVKIKSVIDKKAAKSQFLKELKEAVDFMNLVEQGKTQGRPAEDVIDEL